MLLEHQIIMISEGSCYTEDWRNDAEHLVLNHRNKCTQDQICIFLIFGKKFL